MSMHNFDKNYHLKMSESLNSKIVEAIGKIYIKFNVKISKAEFIRIVLEHYLTRFLEQNESNDIEQALTQMRYL